jgi:hypothetical protein
LWNQEIARIAGADFHDVGFSAKAFDFFFEDDLSVGHGSQEKGLEVRVGAAI